jgi:hypothetical protein
MSIMTWLRAVSIAGALAIVNIAYLAWYLRWEARRTRGNAYFGLPFGARRALRRRIRWYSLPAKPLVHLLARMVGSKATMPSFEYKGVRGPTKLSDVGVFSRATEYRPRPEDVFVVTQMRCGTTWMQQLVYEIVNRGRGDLTDHGHGHIQAVSPWLDAVNTVALEDAPLVGERRTRIIKSHLPAQLCPYSPDAKYIYVARHPVSCFASIVDFNRLMLGPLMPPLATLVDWYCSEQMYWLPWPHHVSGWWQWSEARTNVLFVHFEEMKKDFGAVRDRVARFLGYSLTAEEQRAIDERCTFEYMNRHEEWFEMAPPTMFSVSRGKFLVSGREARHEDVTPRVRERILDYCREALSACSYPAGRVYPDLARPPSGARRAS